MALQSQGPAKPLQVRHSGRTNLTVAGPMSCNVDAMDRRTLLMARWRPGTYGTDG